MNKIVPFVTLAVGLGLGAWWGLHQVAPEAAPVAMRPVMQLTNSANLPGSLVGIDVAALRALLREELAAVLRSKEGIKPASSQAQAAPVSPETLVKRREAQADVDALIAGGVWGDEQRFDFQQKILLLDAEQREHAMQELVIHLNGGALKVETNGPPL